MSARVSARVVWIRNAYQCQMERMGSGEYRLCSEQPIVLADRVGNGNTITLSAGAYRVCDTQGEVLFEAIRDERL